MDTNNNGQAPATDDQELAQVLAGMNQQTTDQPAADAPADSALQFEETGAAPAADAPAPDADAPAADVPQPEVAVPEVPPVPEAMPAVTEPAPEVVTPAPVAAASPELESIKKDALEQLRPLVDKLNLPAEEKFDTLLLIIRSTDDQSLLTAANEAAKSITDEGKRAEALLDVIKEIDFFSGKTQ